MRSWIVRFAALLVLSACATSTRAPIPEPNTIGVQYLYWGNPTGNWSVSRSGQGSATHDGVTTTFAVPPDSFAQMREIFRPYERRDFECNRVVADGPYGYVYWSSRPGTENHRTPFDAGCISGDAEDLFERLSQAEELVETLKTAAQ